MKKQLDDELDHLSDSFGRLRQARSKFLECARNVVEIGADSSRGSLGFSGTAYSKYLDKSILVPLTSSLYVPGKLTCNNRVLVDIGTGYYLEKVNPLFCYL